MKRYDAIESCIANHDIEGLRNAIGSLCYVSRDFSSGDFLEAISYVESKGIKLKEDSLVGELVSKGKTNFTVDDFEDAVFELKENFCQERIDDVMMIGKAVYGGRTKPTQDSASPNAESRPNSDKFPFNVVAAIIAVAAVIILLVKIVSAMRK